MITKKRIGYLEYPGIEKCLNYGIEFINKNTAMDLQWAYPVNEQAAI